MAWPGASQKLAIAPDWGWSSTCAWRNRGRFRSLLTYDIHRPELGSWRRMFCDSIKDKVIVIEPAQV